MWIPLASSHDIPLPSLRTFGIPCAPDAYFPPTRVELLPDLLNTVYRSPNLDALKLLHVPRHFQFPCKALPGLRKLVLSSPIFRISLPLSPNSATASRSPTIATSFPNLKHLDVTNCLNIFDSDLFRLVACLPNLEVLIQRNGEDGAQFLRDLLANPSVASNLRIIDITNSTTDLGEGYDERRKKGLVEMLWSRMEGSKLEVIKWGRGNEYRGSPNDSVEN